MSSMTGIVLVPLLLLLIASPCLGESVAFRHKTDGTVKTGCEKIQGRHDAYPTYWCFDKEGERSTFDPGKDWEEAELKDVCFRHRVRDSIKSNCVEVLGKESKLSSFVCPGEGKDIKLFDPGMDWEQLDKNQHACKEANKKSGKRPPDVPKGGKEKETDKALLLPEQSGGGNTQ